MLITLTEPKSLGKSREVVFQRRQCHVITYGLSSCYVIGCQCQVAIVSVEPCVLPPVSIETISVVWRKEKNSLDIISSSVSLTMSLLL